MGPPCFSTLMTQRRPGQGHSIGESAPPLVVPVDGEYHPIEIDREADGIIRGHSPTLGLDLCWFEGHLCFFDPVTNTWLENLLQAKPQSTEEMRVAAW